MTQKMLENTSLSKIVNTLLKATAGTDPICASFTTTPTLPTVKMTTSWPLCARDGAGGETGPSVVSPVAREQ